LKFLYYDFHLQKCSMSSLVPDGTWRCYLSAFVYVCMLRFWASLVQSPVQQCSNDLYKLYVGLCEQRKQHFTFLFSSSFFPNETVHSNLQIFNNSPFFKQEKEKKLFYKRMILFPFTYITCTLPQHNSVIINAMVFGSNSRYVPKLRLIPFRASLIYFNFIWS